MRRLGLLAVLLAGASGHAGSVAGVEMPERIDIDGRTLTLRSMDLRERTIFNIDVYVWGLYLEDGVANAEQALTRDAAKHLRFQMKRNVDRQLMMESIRDLRQHPAMQKPGLDVALDQLASAFGSVRSGDEIFITYVPGNGTRVSGDVRVQTVILGEDFAEALFTTWLDWFSR